MTGPHALPLTQVIADALTAMTDKVVTATLDIYADEPRLPDGTIANPYDRGVVDGVTTAATSMANGFREAVAEAIATIENGPETA